MGWSLGYDEKWKRDIGYGVPAICDHPDCNKEIDRGLSYVCGDEPFGGGFGCGLFFCAEHRNHTICEDEDAATDPDDPETLCYQACERCANHQEPFTPKPDAKEWIDWKLTDKSWSKWRSENPEWVAKHTRSK